MAHHLTARPSRRRPHLGPEWLSVLEMLILGPLAGYLVLGAIPDAFDVEWSCVSSVGSERSQGEDYVAAFAVFGTLGWFAVLTGSIFAGIADARRLAAILPVAWFVILVGSALVAAATLGPAVCPS
jgi:hypothetical protein